MKTLSIIFAPLLLIVVVVLIRLFPHASNFAPIGALALFGGAKLDKKYSLFLVFSVLIISDYLLLYINPFSPTFINFSEVYPPSAFIHSTTGFVYISFLLIGLIGVWLKKHLSPLNIITSSLFSSILFFMITNFGVWLVEPIAYSHDFSGLMKAYVMGIPFFRNTILGDFFYVGIFFGLYEFANKVIMNRKIITT